MQLYEYPFPLQLLSHYFITSSLELLPSPTCYHVGYMVLPPARQFEHFA